MGNAFESRVDVAVSADDAWAVVGDLTSVPDWYPLYTSCEMDGDVRTASRSDGAVLTEYVFGVDPDSRSYSYTVLSGVPLLAHRASFRVEERGDEATIVWSTAGVHPDPEVDLAERLAGRQQEALEGLKALLESRA